MHIQNISRSDFNINCRGTKHIAKTALGAIASGITATFVRNKKEVFEDEEFTCEDLSEVKEVDDNIFDEEYYQAYYNIDLNLAHNRAFRDNELFNPLRDRENYKYKQYDYDDIGHANNLTYKNSIFEYTTKYKLADTDFGEVQLPNSVTHPHNITENILKIQKRYVELNKRLKQLKISDCDKLIILDACKRDFEGYYEVDYDLVKIALNLYENDQTRFDEQDGAMDIINILKQYDSDSDEYRYLCNYISAGILAQCSNNKIYNMVLKKSAQYNLQ